MTGIIQAELAGHWSQACSYIAPAARATCNGVKLTTKPTGKATVDGVVVSGRLALVKVTGKICLSGNTECQSNANPEEGLPTGSETFKQAYDKGLSDNAFSPVPCIKVNGKWYVNTATG